MNVFEQQVPAGFKRFAGLLEGGGAIDKGKRVTLCAGGNFPNDLVDSGVGAKAQGIQIEGALIVSPGRLKFPQVLEDGREPEVGIGVARINLQRCLEMLDSLIPVLRISTLGSSTCSCTPLVELLF